MSVKLALVEDSPASGASLQWVGLTLQGPVLRQQGSHLHRYTAYRLLLEWREFLRLLCGLLCCPTLTTLLLKQDDTGVHLSRDSDPLVELAFLGAHATARWSVASTKKIAIPACVGRSPFATLSLLSLES